MRDLAADLRELARYAEAGGAPPRLLRVLVELMADDITARRLSRLAADRRLSQLVTQIGPSRAAERLGIDRTTVWRRLVALRADATSPVVESGDDATRSDCAMAPKKSVNVKDATAPASPLYASAKPAVPPTLSGNVPRGTDSLADGQTLGNFKLPTPATLSPVPTQNAAGDVANEVSKEFAK
jgi:hypothetical protein